MTRLERVLVVFLRVVGTMTLLALPFVFVPYSWMNAIHAWMGMGELPSEPIVGYLARSLSAIYALQGGLAWLLSFDVRRHRPTLLYLGAVMLPLGGILLYVDTIEGMPRYWTIVEGPLSMVMGIVILALARRIETPAPCEFSSPDRADSSAER